MDRAEEAGDTVLVGGASLGARQRPDGDGLQDISKALLGTPPYSACSRSGTRRAPYSSARHFKLHAKLFVDTMTELIANLHDLEKVERDVRAGKAPPHLRGPAGALRRDGRGAHRRPRRVVPPPER